MAKRRCLDGAARFANYGYRCASNGTKHVLGLDQLAFASACRLLCSFTSGRRVRLQCVPETPPYPRRAVQSGRLDLSEHAHGTGRADMRSSQFGISSSGGPSSHCLFGVRNTSPQCVRPANQAGEVRNIDAWKHNRILSGLRSQRTSFLSASSNAFVPACLSSAFQLGRTLRG